MHKGFEKALKFLLAKLDLDLGRLSIRNQFHIEGTTRAIGANGAAEVFSYYLKHQNQLADDPEVASFIDFYCDNWRMSSSQWSQDMFVMFGTNLKHGGQFLEIGGADGYTHSNTYALEKRLGWRGTLVEPHPSQYKILTASRPGNNLLNAAISPNGQEETLRLRLCGQLSALDGHEGDDVHRQARTASRELTSVSGISLTRLLAERHFDYFSLDVEGAELKILASVDWDAVRRPDIITVEHNFSEGVREKIVALLQGQGYQERFAAHDWLRRGDIWATLP